MLAFLYPILLACLSGCRSVFLWKAAPLGSIETTKKIRTIRVGILDFFFNFVVGVRPGKSGMASVLVPQRDASDICHQVDLT